MPSARKKSYQKHGSHRSLNSTVTLSDSPGYCQRRPHSSIKSRKLEYIKVAQRTVPRLSAAEMAVAGFNDKHVLIGQVEEYNKRIQLPTFHIKGNFTSDDDVEYEGCLRFFLAHADNNFTKAIRLTSSTNWKTLKPILLEKFNLTEGVESGKLVPILYAVKDSGENSVKDEDCPLVLALMASTHLQFVLRVYQEGSDQHAPPSIDENGKLHQSNSFFSAMKKKLNKTKSKDKLLAPTQTTISTKAQDPVGPNPHKHGRQRSGDSGSLGSRKKSDASSRKSAASYAANLANSSAANARSMENLSKAGKTLKKKKKGGNTMGSSVSNMLAIDNTEEFITIHADAQDIGFDELSVPIDGSMTVRDLVADVLEECEISLARVDDYCLCDVIGRECEGLWLTDYARDMNDNEKPLLLISMMKPSEGLSRRFEIKNISKEEEVGSHAASGHNEQLSYEMRDFRRHNSQSLSSISNLTDYSSQTLKFPTDCPYFLTIQSFDSQQDAVLHLINRTTAIIGNSEDEDKCNMRLFAPDILAQHCWICKVYDSEDEMEFKCISLAPFPGAVVRINEEEITQKTNIQPGDIVTLGQHYIFIFKDPTCPKEGPRSNKSLTRQALAPNTEEKSSLYEDEAQWHQVAAMSLSFTSDKQEELLAKVFQLMDPSSEGYKLTPAYLLALALEHSRTSMKREDLTTFLTKMCTDFQNIILEVTKSLQVHTQDMDSCNPMECLEQVDSQLHSILFWMSNCIELRGFLSINQPTYSTALGNAELMDEAMNILSDTVVFAFQQAVYHLTKVLYPTLDLILTDNPFSRVPSDNPTMNETLQAMTLILDVCNNKLVNKSIIQQLFSYLYFFIGTSLCNKMFEGGNKSLRKESVSILYNWEEGVKIRKNIELLENWSHDVQMEAANNYLNKVVSIADFLATSKQFLLQASWSQLRNLYPLLGAAQLRHLLDNYDLGNRAIPSQWSAPADEVYRIMEEGIMESFDDHPPLVIPSNSRIQLDIPVEDKVFNSHLEHINTTYGQHQSEDETDSGFDLGHSRSPTEADENGKSFSEHVKCGPTSSNASESGGKSYTPLFKKKRQTPPVRRSTNKSKQKEYIMSKHTESSDENEGELTSQLDHVTLHDSSYPAAV